MHSRTSLSSLLIDRYSKACYYTVLYTLERVEVAFRDFEFLFTILLFEKEEQLVYIYMYNRVSIKLLYYEDISIYVYVLYFAQQI